MRIVRGVKETRGWREEPKTISTSNDAMDTPSFATSEAGCCHFLVVNTIAVPAYACCEERITYESRRVSRENFRREQPPLFDCQDCKKPFVFDYLLRRHKLIYAGSCKPEIPSHLEWVKADKFSKAAMQRIVDIFYSHLVSDRLKGKRGAGEAMMAASGGAGFKGDVMEGESVRGAKRRCAANIYGTWCQSQEQR